MTYICCVLDKRQNYIELHVLIKIVINDRGQIRQLKITPLEHTRLELRTCMILMHSRFKHVLTVSVRILQFKTHNVQPVKGEFGHTSTKRLDPLTVTFASPAASIALFSRVYRGREAEEISVHVSPMPLQLLGVLRPTLSRFFQIQESLPFQFPKVEADRRAVVYEIPYAQVVLKLLPVVNRSLPVDPIPGNVTNDEFAVKFAPLIFLGRELPTTITHTAGSNSSGWHHQNRLYVQLHYASYQLSMDPNTTIIQTSTKQRRLISWRMSGFRVHRPPI